MTASRVTSSSRFTIASFLVVLKGVLIGLEGLLVGDKPIQELVIVLSDGCQARYGLLVTLGGGLEGG